MPIPALKWLEMYAKHGSVVTFSRDPGCNHTADMALHQLIHSYTLNKPIVQFEIWFNFWGVWEVQGSVLEDEPRFRRFDVLNFKVHSNTVRPWNNAALISAIFEITRFWLLCLESLV